MRFTLLVIPLFAAASVFAQERYVRPVDEASQDASFLAFRTTLVAAAERHDSKFILSILDPRIELSFGGHRGIKDFNELWEIEKPNSKFWGEFLPVIKNGGTFGRRNGKRTNVFFAPYTFTSFPNDLDGYEHSAIFGRNVNLRERPESNARVIEMLSYNVVQVEEAVPQEANAGEAEWYKVRTLGGKRGYVKAEYVRSPLGYRAGFEKKRGKWKMTVFIAGD